MNIDKSVYRILVSEKERDRFLDALSGIRTGENKIQRIAPGAELHAMDVIITEEELAFLRLSFTAKDVWLQDW